MIRIYVLSIVSPAIAIVTPIKKVVVCFLPTANNSVSYQLSNKLLVSVRDSIVNSSGTLDCSIISYVEARAALHIENPSIKCGGVLSVPIKSREKSELTVSGVKLSN